MQGERRGAASVASEAKEGNEGESGVAREAEVELYSSESDSESVS